MLLTLAARLVTGKTVLGGGIQEVACLTKVRTYFEGRIQIFRGVATTSAFSRGSAVSAFALAGSARPLVGVGCGRALRSAGRLVQVVIRGTGPA